MTTISYVSGIEARSENYAMELRRLIALKEEQQELESSFESKMKEVKMRIENSNKKISRAALLYYHPQITELEQYLPILDITMLCLSYTGESFCVECKTIFFGDECIHKISENQAIKYNLKEKFVHNTKCRKGNITYACYKVESIEDQELLEYWRKVAGDELDEYKCDVCTFPLFCRFAAHLSFIKIKQLTLWKYCGRFVIDIQ